MTRACEGDLAGARWESLGDGNWNLETLAGPVQSVEEGVQMKAKGARGLMGDLGRAERVQVQ